MRLIDANEVVKNIVAERDKIPRTVQAAPYELVAEKPFNHGNSMRGGIRKALRCIEQAPTVDAVPVVRCRECKHRYTEDCPMFFHASYWHKGYGEYVDYDTDHTEDDYFCQEGERKEGAE